MNINNEYKVPSLFQRIFSVWSRHDRVYNSNFFSNAFPSFFEPVIFLIGIGIGLGKMIPKVGGVDYILFLATGLIVTSSMFSASYECTFGTFIRLEFDHVYDGMLGAPISTYNVIIGEIFFAGTKGVLFTFGVLAVTWISGIIRYPLSILSIAIGFISGIMFAAMAMYITSFVRSINHLNFYFTGLLSPMFFFSGIVFPIETLPKTLRYISEIIPLTHVVRLARAFCVPGLLNAWLILDFIYCIGFIALFGWLAVKRMKKRMIV